MRPTSPSASPFRLSPHSPHGRAVIEGETGTFDRSKYSCKRSSYPVAARTWYYPVSSNLDQIHDLSHAKEIQIRQFHHQIASQIILLLTRKTLTRSTLLNREDWSCTS
ncbi:hypothetical protein QCA50_020464 [Cerrena zonata]|uniref:Uncharacterized protein n=1 Tax=Cerrena zonata TaxID=2478898 RepID=A0AAW0F935_9APHY